MNGPTYIKKMQMIQRNTTLIFPPKLTKAGVYIR